MSEEVYLINLFLTLVEIHIKGGWKDESNCEK